MSILLFVPGILQGLIMLIDEFIFHHRRGLPTWEIWGHPLDTLSVILTLGFLIYFPPTDLNLRIYIGLAIFSCLLVTKDEFVHKKFCSGGEIWLHSLLFLLHPISFLAFSILWLHEEGHVFLIGQWLVTFIFMIYQILYWGKPWQLLRRQQ